MLTGLLVVAIILGLVAIALQILQLRRRVDFDLSCIHPMFASVEKAHERTERSVREEIGKNREEASNAARQGREEVGATLRALGEMLSNRLGELIRLNEEKLDRLRTDASVSARATREETVNALKSFSQSLGAQLEKLTESSEKRMDAVKGVVEERLKSIQEDNSASLEKMRHTVDEKLHATLEHRLGESFKLVSERLELVHKGLGEMQSLAHGVGDLKKVLTNIKTRGNWGEMQLGNLLEQMLTPEQYGVNVQTNPSTMDRVEYAIKLPGKDTDGKCVWLPIDAKFPQEDYQRLVEAAERGDAEQVAACAISLEARICLEAKKIKEKYLHPPHTTDFALLFLPTEGLFAEVLRRPGLCDRMLHDHRVVLTGPTTLSAVLSSLQMGFRTLIIEKRSSEVWQVLGAVKTEFGKFGDVLDKIQKKLQEAANTVDSAATRSRVLERKLKQVQGLPPLEATKLLGTIDVEAMEVDNVDEAAA